MLRGTDISSLARIGSELRLMHAGNGVAIHSHTTIGNRVTIFHNVTLGRRDVWRYDTNFGGFVIEDDVILCAGAVLLADGPDPLVVRRGSIIGANAVLTRSTGVGELWAGVPARCVGHRDGWAEEERRQGKSA